MSFAKKFQPAEFEQKWSQVWETDRLYATPKLTDRSKKKYVLDMFPYPSGAGLHVGHVEGYTATDIYCRYLRMNGYQVLHPMGFDSFGLPAENYAIKTGKHPKITTDEAIEMFTKQMKAAGFSYDWDLVLAAHWPQYYKWTQWLFLLLYKRGLAYRKKQAVNWDPVDQTVLANEQVLPDGTAERSGAKVVQKELEQWFFKITDYAERLLQDLDKLDWPESTKMAQRNWIGKSEGINITYPIKDQKGIEVTVFTTRPDTNFGATFVVCAPDSKFAKDNLRAFPQRETVEKYIHESKKKRELERLSKERQKTGVFTGWYAINRLNGREMPVYVADFVLGTVGTGCVVGVPGHDTRDFEFAQTMKLPIVRVVAPRLGEIDGIARIDQVHEADGIIINSGFLDGMDTRTAAKRIMDHLEEKGWGKLTINYRLRDWLISRQRFWGTPIPMRRVLKDKSRVSQINVSITEATGDEHQEYVYEPVPESELPVVLPMDVEFKPTGKSPLTEHPDFVDREVDTMDTFVDSSWYFFRFAMLTCEKVKEAQKSGKEHNPFEDAQVMKIMKDWSPVDLYVGGAEHTVLHLLYSRFLTKVLFDAGYIDFDEPFLKLRHQGVIMGPDHRKMSKRWGNIINPLDVISQYGADTLRMYEMFMGPLDQPKAWNVKSVAGVFRFLNRVWNASHIVFDARVIESDRDLRIALHETLKKVDEDTPQLRFNTAIARMMEFMNLWEKKPRKLSLADWKIFVRMLAPYAPFMTEELWSISGENESIHRQSWPSYDARLLEVGTIEIPVQVNGRVRDTIAIPFEKTEEEGYVVEKAKSSQKVQKFIGLGVKKVVFVPGRIVNLIT